MDVHLSIEDGSVTVLKVDGFRFVIIFGRVWGQRPYSEYCSLEDYRRAKREAKRMWKEKIFF